MKRTGRKKEWSILGFCVFLLGIFPPVLFIFDKPVLIFDLPLSFLYLYGFWALMIVFMAIGARRRHSLHEDSEFTPKHDEEKNAPSVSVKDYV